jgi:hypothetical protein
MNVPAETAAVQPMRALLDLDSLSDFLWESDYGFEERVAIARSVQRHHSLRPAAQCGMVDREDLVVATLILHEANACLGAPTDAELRAFWPGSDGS